VKRITSLVWLEIYSRRKRIAALALFGALYLIGAVAARVIGTGEHGQVEPDKLMMVGGYPLLSAFLLSGWSIGRFPIVIVLVMVGGLFSADVRAGYTRLYAATRVRILALYAFRLLLLMLLAFALAATVLPVFDYIILRKPSGLQLYVLTAAYVLVFGSLTALFSVFTKADAWAALFAWIAATVWYALLRGGLLDRVPQLLTQAISVVLPPQAALNTIENAFGNGQAVPWGAFLYVCMYAAIILLIAGLALTRREI
jgi:hypothetical protein